MRHSPIPNTFFINNRKKLVEQLESDSIALLYSNYQMPRNGDQYFHPYRQNSDLFYLTGIEQEKSVLLLYPNSANAELCEVLFIIRSTPKMEIWEGKKLTTAEASAISGIEHVAYLDEFESMLEQVVPKTQHLYFNIGNHPNDLLSQDAVEANKYQERYPGCEIKSLQPILQQMRLIKSEVEIELIRNAIKITHEALLSVLKFLKPGCREYELEALIAYEAMRRGASGHAFTPVIASGGNACVLHYIENNDICKMGDLVLMDFGAEYANYASDLSRTIPVNGKYTTRQLELYNMVLRTFRFAKSLMKPGITINQLHDEVCRFVQEEHLKLGLYTSKEISEHKGEKPLWFNYYMHGTSHFMGLDVHDVGTKDIPLQPGMVITCEPGIYIADEGVGIRIENDILITESGHEDLMDEIPIEALAIEELMNIN